MVGEAPTLLGGEQAGEIQHMEQAVAMRDLGRDAPIEGQVPGHRTDRRLRNDDEVVGPIDEEGRGRVRVENEVAIGIVGLGIPPGRQAEEAGEVDHRDGHSTEVEKAHQ